jgi:uncharacterized membrane protein
MPNKMVRSIIVKGNISDIYALWENFENFPHFMKNIKSVKRINNETSHWTMEGPLGKDLEWDAQVTTLEPPKRIAWNSLDGNIKTSGEVTFNDLNSNETQVNVTMQYVPPAGKAGEVVAHVIDAPDKKLDEDLKRFKQYAESISAIKTT